MKITNETKLTQQSTMFADGANSYFLQTYELSADDKELEITMTVEGNLGKNNTTRSFNGFDTLKEACEEAGHEWCRGE